MKKIVVVGLGPGERDQMTFEAAKVLERCDVLVGYQYYIDSIKDQYPHKRLLATPMRREVERCVRIGRDCPGFFMAVGNHIPSNVPVENALYYNQCYEEMAYRD